MKWRWSDRVEVTWDRIRGKSKRSYRIFHPEDLKRRDDHQAALLRLGFLQERTFRLIHRPARDVALSASKAAGAILSDERRYFLTLMIYNPTDTNMLKLVAVAEDVPVWEELIRKADVPEGGKL